MALGSKIKKIRELKRLSQDQLSVLTGGIVSQGAISALEKRDARSSRFTKQLADALCVTVETLIGNNSYQAKEEIAEYIPRDPILDDLAALLPEDADIWRAQIRGAAIKARREKQEKSDRESANKALDSPLEEKRTA